MDSSVGTYKVHSGFVEHGSRLDRVNIQTRSETSIPERDQKCQGMVAIKIVDRIECESLTVEGIMLWVGNLIGNW
jgi:hypothetical protein